jgi:threonine 3-dehydrogenase
MPYTEFQKGFDAMLSGQSGKVILNWRQPQKPSGN